MIQGNHLYQGDNLQVMQQYIGDETVDLIYLDPPFYSNRDYHTLKGNTKNPITNSIEKVFNDTWQWNKTAADTLNKLKDDGDPHLAGTIFGLREILSETGMLAYLLMMAPRLAEIQRVLKTSGSVYLHCDQKASAYLRILMDGVFGSENFLNCIVWCYGLGGSSPRYWPRKHDDILWYAKKAGEHYFAPVKIPASSQKMKGKLKKLPDFWSIPTINNMAKERLGYPTQKPEALLERIIISSSREGDTVLDPFCGSGTTLFVAHKLGRKWIGIDNSEKAIDLVKHRFKEQNYED